MSEEFNSFATEPAQVIGPRRRTKRDRNSRRSRRASCQRGRLMLLGIFCVLVGMNALVYFGVPRDGETSGPASAIMASSVWYTALMVGIWRRRDWCRNVLICVQLLAVAVFMIVVPSSLQILDNSRALGIFAANISVLAAIAWTLMRSPDIKRLTSRSYD
jgi:uncharacterized MnhB-related membrane protein